MKKIVLIIVLSVTTYSFGQDNEFKFSKEGFTDYIVTPVENKTQNELYAKTLQWVSLTFKEPRDVVKATIENEYIRIEGYSKELICYSYMGKRCGDTKYEIEISFKDGKYKFDVLSISEYNNMSKSIMWTDFNIVDTSNYYDKKGSVKSSYKFIAETVPGFFNNLNLDLKSYLVSDAIPSKKSEW